MFKQLLFCLETNEQAATDWVYISETISKYYQVSNQVKLSQVFMNAKMRYNSKDVLKKIAKKKTDYSLGDTHVIYCIDVDDFESNPDHVREYDEIKEFCNRNSYDFIWFCHDVEDVYLKKRISKHEKTKEAAAFRTKKGIESVEKTALISTNSHKCHSSNILLILDKYLE